VSCAELLNGGLLVDFAGRKLRRSKGLKTQASSHLALQLPLRPLQVFEQQVFAGELVVVWEMVDALPV